MYVNKTHNRKLCFIYLHELFKDYITNQRKELDLNVVKYDSEIVFDGEFYPHTKFDLQYSTTIFQFKCFCYIGIIVLVKEDINFLIYETIETSISIEK